jgi:hypothetical protein
LNRVEGGPGQERGKTEYQPLLVRECVLVGKSLF